MFRRLPDPEGRPVAFTIDGRPASARAGNTVSGALLTAGVDVCPTPPPRCRALLARLIA